ncbi:hypothetical protein B0T13DRAFT_463271 [Neurospora crassa]|nr:hypothetical protein B0T13DRAFT_463271 [Neurospora crassa]
MSRRQNRQKPSRTLLSIPPALRARTACYARTTCRPVLLREYVLDHDHCSQLERQTGDGRSYQEKTKALDSGCEECPPLLIRNSRTPQCRVPNSGVETRCDSNDQELSHVFAHHIPSAPSVPIPLPLRLHPVSCLPHFYHGNAQSWRANRQLLSCCLR